MTKSDDECRLSEVGTDDPSIDDDSQANGTRSEAGHQQQPCFAFFDGVFIEIWVQYPALKSVPEFPYIFYEVHYSSMSGKSRKTRVGPSPLTSMASRSSKRKYLEA